MSADIDMIGNAISVMASEPVNLFAELLLIASGVIPMRETHIGSAPFSPCAAYPASCPTAWPLINFKR